METHEIILLIVAGFAVGLINTLAGGATVISLAALMSLGLPVGMANATHRIAAFFQTLASSGSFRYQKVLDLKQGIRFAIPVGLGSIIGAFISIEINEELFRKIVGVVIILMMILILFRPKQWLEGKVVPDGKKISPLQYLLFFVMGIYGGFIHIGIGYFLLGGLVLGAGYDMVKANAIKVFIVLIYVGITLFVFIWKDMIDYRYGFVLAIGQVAGAITGARLATKLGVGFIRWFMVVFISVTALQLFEVIRLENVIRIF